MNLKRKILVGLSMLALVGASLSAQEQVRLEDPFQPFLPSIMGQGGSFGAIAQGYESMFSNPAGYSYGGNEITFLSLGVWSHIRPDQTGAFIDSLATADGVSTSDIVSFIADQVAENGVGIGASGGIGLVLGGVGLGVHSSFDFFMRGAPFPGGVTGVLVNENAFVGGFAFPLRFADDFVLHVGADIQPFVRVFQEIDSETIGDLLNAFSGSGSAEEVLFGTTVLSGWGMALNTGAILEIGPFTASLSVRDLFGTSPAYSSTTLGNVIDNFEFGSSTGGDPDVRYVIPMSVNIGGSFHPDLGGLSFLIDPIVHAEIHDVLFITDEAGLPDNFWTRVHIGAEARVLRVFSVYGGVNQGYLTAGLGIDLPLFELKGSVFSREFGRYPGDAPSAGASIQIDLAL